jgi:hypothetical protein
MNQPLAEAIFWIAAIACVIGELMILRSSFAAPRNNEVAMAATASRGLELAWAVIPAIALGVLLLATRRAVDARGAHLEMHHSPGAAMTMPQHSP